tara:strand:+ start:143 stop:385 length:243 start_codon:yes stop_codon:yes gene_type:complete
MKEPIDFPVILTEKKLNALVRKFALWIVQAKIGSEAMIIPNPNDPETSIYSKEAEKMLKIEIEEIKESMEDFFKIGLYRQ